MHEYIERCTDRMSGPEIYLGEPIQDVPQDVVVVLLGHHVWHPRDRRNPEYCGPGKRQDGRHIPQTVSPASNSLLIIFTKQVSVSRICWVRICWEEAISYEILPPCARMKLVY
jgi:hypothetical protein